MPRRRAAPIAPRKQPKQARSAHLVEAILEAAARVLEKDGAAAFTTIRVAEQAGVSVGSLYQYFPNKESILFRLQQDEWAATGRLLDGIFADTRLGTPPNGCGAAMLRVLPHGSVTKRAAAASARRRGAPLYRDAPQARAQRERGLRRFLLALIVGKAGDPGRPPRRRTFAAKLVHRHPHYGRWASTSRRPPAPGPRSTRGRRRPPTCSSPGCARRSGR